MRQGLFAFLICVVLSVSGCSAGKPDSAASERVQSEAEKTEASKTEDVKEKKKESAEEKSKEAAEADKEKSKEAAEADKEKSKEATETDKEKSAEKVSKESAASEQKKTEEKKTEDKSAEKTSEESAVSEEKKAQEKDTEKKESPKREDSKKAEESEKKEETKKEESRKKEKDLKQESKEKYADDYIPEGFTPYGSYVLVYDSGYEVKTRLSKAGLTYYYEGEEFLFTLDKNLPDMTREAAHILFNTAAPMDPANTEGEEFPFGEGFVIYISLDDGSYYEIPSYSLDLNGRVFARDIFETFRQKWEGAF